MYDVCPAEAQVAGTGGYPSLPRGLRAKPSDFQRRPPPPRGSAPEDRLAGERLRLHGPTLDPTMKKRFAEFLGTFALVFSGTGAIVINHASGGSITHAGIAITFGLIVLAMIYTFGDVSGAHLNPSVTIAFAAARRFPWQ